MQKPKPVQCKRSQRQRKPNDLSRCLVPLISDETLIAVVELSLTGWLVAGVVPGVERQPLKKLKPEPDRLLELLQRWRSEAERSGHRITRIAVAYEAGRDGFWLARTLKEQGIEVHVIHPASIAVSREHRRAKPPVSTSSNLLSTLQRRFACARLPTPHLPRSCLDFSATLTTIAFDDSSLQRFGACS